MSCREKHRPWWACLFVAQAVYSIPSVTQIGGFLAGIILAPMSDRLGRKTIILLWSVHRLRACCCLPDFALAVSSLPPSIWALIRSRALTAARSLCCSDARSTLPRIVLSCYTTTIWLLLMYAARGSYGWFLLTAGSS